MTHDRFGRVQVRPVPPWKLTHKRPSDVDPRPGVLKNTVRPKILHYTTEKIVHWSSKSHRILVVNTLDLLYHGCILFLFFHSHRGSSDHVSDLVMMFPTFDLICEETGLVKLLLLWRIQRELGNIGIWEVGGRRCFIIPDKARVRGTRRKRNWSGKNYCYDRG